MPHIYLSIYPSIYLSIHPSIYLPIYLSIYLQLQQKKDTAKSHLFSFQNIQDPDAYGGIACEMPSSPIRQRPVA